MQTRVSSPISVLSRVTLALAAFLALIAAGCGGVQRPDGGSGPLAVGSSVPDLAKNDHRGAPVRLREPKPTLVYFYPKDGTPGCTREACAFRDAWQLYSDAGLRVVGVSADDDASHREFADEHELPFALIADPDHVWSQAFGVGTFAGMDARVSFLIDTNGRVVKTYRDVDPGVHAAEVLEDAKQLELVD